MRATKLETLALEYQKIEANKNESKKIMGEKRMKLQDEIKRLERKVDGHKTILNLRSKKGTLHKELVWAKVRDAELELQDQKSKMEAIETKWNESKANSARRADKVNKLKEKIRELEQTISQLKDQIKVQNIPQMDIRRQLEELSQKYREKQRERQQIGDNHGS
ncbi:hypothetical protein NQ318_022785 [Aromia moschata]|uniref:Uncharacterized protein n=1 Tax=Aromia moschata TaxID=1265417 RepID=A0AAV8YEI3_9CUCU|nr:hypothetical protein NQ318_022785 [Aromia moschata]